MPANSSSNLSQSRGLSTALVIIRYFYISLSLAFFRDAKSQLNSLISGQLCSIPHPIV